MEHMKQPGKNSAQHRGIRPLKGDALMQKVMEEQGTIEVVKKTTEEKFADLRRDARTPLEIKSLKEAIQEQISAEGRKAHKTNLDRRLSDMKVDQLRKKLANMHEKPGHA